MEFVGIDEENEDFERVSFRLRLLEFSFGISVRKTLALFNNCR